MTKEQLSIRREYQRIHVSSMEEYMKSEDWRRNWIANNRPAEELAAHDKRVSDKEDKRKEYRERFPYTAILEGAYPEHDFVSRWCWQNIGPPQCEKCYDHQSEYPGCPLVLATEYIQTGWYNTSDGKRVDWSEKAYKEVDEHSHEGTWMAYWLGKTGYDYGFSEYYFQNEQDRDRFLAAAPTFSLGEKYEKEDAEMTTTINTTEKKVHQSKWGFHPISREASKKLRFINGVYAKAQHVAGAWERWDRKQPHNRVLRRTLKDENGKKRREIVVDAAGKPVPWPEPQVCPLFHTTQPGYTDKWGSIVWGRAVDNGYGQEIIEASRQARTPQPTPEDVQPFPFTEEEIDRLYETAKAWLESR